MKRKHNLYRNRDAASLLTALGAHAIDFAGLVGRFVDTSAPFSALLVGSLAEGTGNAASDVDILIIVEDANLLHIDKKYPRLDDGKSIEILIYDYGIEFNFRFVEWRDVLPVKTAFEILLENLSSSENAFSVPYLSTADLRLLHQLRSGWLLAGTNLVRSWNEALMTNLLPSYLAVRHFNEFNESLEDAVAMVEDHPISSICAARGAVQNAVLAVLTGRGFTSPSHKWMFHWMVQCGNRELEGVFDLGREILLADWRRREPELIAVSRQLGELVEPVITLDPAVSVALKRLRQLISYVPAS